MNRRNYARELNKLEQSFNGRKPRLLIHACCGPCSSSVLESLIPFFDITILWYNPNIYPIEEFNKRYDTLTELLEKMHIDNIVKVLSMEWKGDKYLEAVSGLEDEPEGGKRCEKCFELRLEETAKIAKEGRFDYFCSTLTVSRHKDAVLINTIGERIAKKYDVNWLPSDFKKNNGENRSVELSEYFNIYRQLYCGCVFSLNRRNAGKQ